MTLSKTTNEENPFEVLAIMLVLFLTGIGLATFAVSLIGCFGLNTECPRGDMIAELPSCDKDLDHTDFDSDSDYFYWRADCEKSHGSPPGPTLPEDPETYEVSPDGTLPWIETEDTAESLYPGSNYSLGHDNSSPHGYDDDDSAR